MPVDKPVAEHGAYSRVFEGHHEGRLILEDLMQRFQRGLWVKGGVEGARETDRRIGQREVLEYIVLRINRDNGVNDHEDTDNPTA